MSDFLEKLFRRWAEPQEPQAPQDPLRRYCSEITEAGQSFFRTFGDDYPNVAVLVIRSLDQDHFIQRNIPEGVRGTVLLFPSQLKWARDVLIRQEQGVDHSLEDIQAANLIIDIQRKIVLAEAQYQRALNLPSIETF